MLPPFVRLLLLVCLLAGCADGDGTDDARARRARQMRDVSRMLDAMEQPDQAPPPREATAIPASTPPPAPTEAAPPLRASTHRRWLTLAGVALALLAMATPLAWRRRRRPRRPPDDNAAAPVPAHFAGAPIAPPDGTHAARSRPTWIYRTSPYETPVLHMVPAPVDLLPPYRSEPTPAAALALAHEAMQRARRLSGSEADEACSIALMHAFLAEQEPSLRAEATACRQAITAFYEALPHRGR